MSEKYTQHNSKMQSTVRRDHGNTRDNKHQTRYQLPEHHQYKYDFVYRTWCVEGGGKSITFSFCFFFSLSLSPIQCPLVCLCVSVCATQIQHDGHNNRNNIIFFDSFSFSISLSPSDRSVCWRSIINYNQILFLPFFNKYFHFGTQDYSSFSVASSINRMKNWCAHLIKNDGKWISSEC